MRQLLVGSLCLVTFAFPSFAADDVSVVAVPATDATNRHYVGHRAPLRAAPLIKLPVGSIQPRGWLRKQLRLQADGFHGHLGEISRFLVKEGSAWLDQEGAGTHGWEEPPYWLKGYSNVGYVLRDEGMIAESKVWIEGALRSQKPDGWFGPDKGRGGAATRLKGRDDLWPNMIMLFCLQDYYEFTGDERVIQLMTKYFRYLAAVPDERFLVGYWPKMRGGDLLFSVYWLYNRTGGEWMLELAEKVHRRTADWTSGVINWHNVNMAQGFGQPTTYFLQSKEERHLKASYANWDEMHEKYGQVPGGMFGGDENCRPGFAGPRQAIETCGITEMMLSTETLTAITGDVTWADRCEDVTFNSLPAALTADIKALRYLTSPNMVLSDRHNKSPGLQNGGPMLHMNPHGHRCCQHNWGHAWPYYAQHLWFATPDDGLAAVLYSESAVKAKVGADGVGVELAQTTHYPFDEEVAIALMTPRSVRFPLYLRVPGWCEGATVAVNGKAVKVAARPGSYIRIERSWSSGDRVDLRLPMEISVRRWEKNLDSVSVDRGPLTYSLKIGEDYRREGGTDEWPAWEIHPTTPWNYGLVLKDADAAASFGVVRHSWPTDDMPFTHGGTPISLRARGKRIPEWQQDHLGLVGKLQPSPVKSAQETEAITLIPMGAARLRITSFPVIGDGPNSTTWKAPPQPAYKVNVSHCWGGDTPRGVADGVDPSSSSDHSIPRLTFWDHRGTSEWVEARFSEPKKVSRVRVYWFDDTGRGHCRLPVSWKLLYADGIRWQPVKTEDAYGVAKDRFNDVSFDAVTTMALRIEIQLQPEFSGGVLEWKVE